MLVQEWGTTAHAFVADRIAFFAQLSQSRFHIESVPEDDHVQHKAKRSKLIFLAFAGVLAQFAALAVEDGPGDTMAPLTPTELVQRGSAPHSRINSSIPLGSSTSLRSAGSTSTSPGITSGKAKDRHRADSGRSALKISLSVLYCPSSDATPRTRRFEKLRCYSSTNEGGLSDLR